MVPIRRWTASVDGESARRASGIRFVAAAVSPCGVRGGSIDRVDLGEALGLERRIIAAARIRRDAEVVGDGQVAGGLRVERVGAFPADWRAATWTSAATLPPATMAGASI
jgi:hypothetical protein